MVKKHDYKKCKRKRVRENKDGTFNQEDLDHNQRCQDLYELQDYEKMMNKDKKKKKDKKDKKRTKRKKKTKKKKKSGGGSHCSCYSGECSYCQEIREEGDELLKKELLDQEIQRTETLISQIKQDSKKGGIKKPKLSNPPLQFQNMDVLKYIRSLGITLPEYNLLKQISEKNGEPIENVLQFFNQYKKTGLTLQEIVEAYQLGGILEICDDLSECRTLLHSKKESIRLMRERMIQEFCKAKNDTGCVGITSPEFLRFLHYFRPPPSSGDYPENELLDYVRVWNDCQCGSNIDYSGPSVWMDKRSL
jgi:hypothetical protein